jgi:hypothetical protein
MNHSFAMSHEFIKQSRRDMAVDTQDETGPMALTDREKMRLRYLCSVSDLLTRLLRLQTVASSTAC